MTDVPTLDPENDTERLKADLADRERELEELKRENARTKEVGNALWTHEIYINARKKLTFGVVIVLGILSAVGLGTVGQLFFKGLEYVDGELRNFIGERITVRVIRQDRTHHRTNRFIFTHAKRRD